MKISVFFLGLFAGMLLEDLGGYLVTGLWPREIAVILRADR